MIEKDLSLFMQKKVEPYTIKLESAQEIYKEGEKIDVQATLTNTSSEVKSIGHGDSWVGMAVHNLTEDYQFGYAMNEPYIVTTVKPNEIITEQYNFSGGSYISNQPGRKYSDEDVQKMSTLYFTKGQYEIVAHFNFIDEETSITYKEALSIVFEVQ